MRQILICAMLAGLAGPAIAANISAKPGEYRIDDGMTIVLKDKMVKLRHVAVPPLGRACMMRGKQRDCGLISRSSLLDLSAAATIKCDASADGYGRCTAGGFDLAEQIVYTGWAVPVSGAPKKYWKQMAGARARKRGFWNAQFVEPWVPLEAALRR